VRRLAQPVTVPEERRRLLAFTDDGVRRWREYYGIDFTPLLETGHGQTGPAFVRSADALGGGSVSRRCRHR
jgi:hypothetical protein